MDVICIDYHRICCHVHRIFTIIAGNGFWQHDHIHWNYCCAVHHRRRIGGLGQQNVCNDGYTHLYFIFSIKRINPFGNFLVYTTESLASTFFITAGTFGVMSIYGYTTNADLSKMKNLLFMGLMGLVIASIANIFMKSEMIYWITTYLGVLIFVGLTAYDTQKIKNMNIIGNEGTDEDRKEAIMGALHFTLIL